MPRLTTPEFIQKAVAKHQDRYDYSDTVYKSSLEKVAIRCRIHGEFWQIPTGHLAGRGCQKCAREASKRDQVWTTEKFIEKAREVHGNIYDYSNTEYVYSKTKLTVNCREHGCFSQLPTMHLIGAGCPTCGRQKSKEQFKAFDTTEETARFVRRCQHRFGERYDLSKVDYKGHKSKIEVTCNVHEHDFCVVASAFVNSANGCPGCKKFRQDLIKNTALQLSPLQKFLSVAEEIHGNKYDYKLVLYERSRLPVCIICPCHGEFQMTPNHHLIRRTGCPKCGVERAAKTRTMTDAEFVRLAELRHGKRYDYDKVVCTGCDNEVRIGCPSHGIFLQTPQNHLRGCGCPPCGKQQRYDTGSYVAQAREVHGDRFGYERTEYINAHKKVIITCQVHGDFEQTAFQHLKGNGCRLCWQGANSSKAQIAWLEYMMVRHKCHIRHAQNGGEFRIPNSRFSADGYCAKTNTVFEFHGKLFHADPRVYKRTDCIPMLKISAGDLYDKTIARDEFIRKQGFDLVVMWETEWNDMRRKAVKIQRYSMQSRLLCKVLLAMGMEIYYIDCGIPCQNTQELFNIHQIRSMYQQQHPEFLPNIDEQMDLLKRITFVRYMYDVFPRELHVKDFNDLIERHNISHFLMFLDIWIIKSDEPDRFACPALCWLPIHFDPIEELTVRAAGLFDTIVCLSHDGVRRLKPLLPDKKILRIPHVIDFEHFNLNPVDRPVVRRSMGIPEDCFLVTLVYNLSEQTGRKQVEVALSAFQIFNAKHPNSRLYIHSKLEHGVDANELIYYLDIRHLIIASDQKKMAKGGYTSDFVVNLMKVSDVLFNATASEGFGLPIAEANAVGTPVVAANSTAMPDNLYNGELCKIYQKKFCLQNTSYWFIPDVNDSAKCIEKIYMRSPEEKRRLSRYGMKCIRENYNLKTLYDAWKPLFE